MNGELDKVISDLVDKRVKDLYNQGFQDTTNILNELKKRIEEVELTMLESEQVSRRFREIEAKITEEAFEQQVAKMMLQLMPEFKTKISNEIKDHLVAIAEYVIENFKKRE